MKIICLLKFIPDVENFKYDYEKNILVRENSKLILNPDDCSALEYALSLKDKKDDVHIHVITMGPKNVDELLKDVIRRGADCATLITDKNFAGSDSLVTAKILSEYIKTLDYDLILSGNNTLDGDTGHIGGQICEYLNIEQYSNICKILDVSDEKASFEVEFEKTKVSFTLDLPCVLSVTKNVVKKLRFVKYDRLKENVDSKLNYITNDELKISVDMIGIKGSPTVVTKTKPVRLEEKSNKIYVTTDDEGIEIVYEFLKDKGII